MINMQQKQKTMEVEKIKQEIITEVESIIEKLGGINAVEKLIDENETTETLSSEKKKRNFGKNKL